MAAERLFDEMRGRTQPDEASCVQLLRLYAARGKVRKSFSLYNRMKEWRVRFSNYTFNVLINSYAKGMCLAHCYNGCTV